MLGWVRDGQGTKGEGGRGPAWREGAIRASMGLTLECQSHVIRRLSLGGKPEAAVLGKVCSLQSCIGVQSMSVTEVVVDFGVLGCAICEDHPSKDVHRCLFKGPKEDVNSFITAHYDLHPAIWLRFSRISGMN